MMRIHFLSLNYVLRKLDRFQAWGRISCFLWLNSISILKIFKPLAGSEDRGKLLEQKDLMIVLYVMHNKIIPDIITLHSNVLYLSNWNTTYAAIPKTNLPTDRMGVGYLPEEPNMSLKFHFKHDNPRRLTQGRWIKGKQ